MSTSKKNAPISRETIMKLQEENSDLKNQVVELKAYRPILEVFTGMLVAMMQRTIPGGQCSFTGSSVYEKGKGVTAVVIDFEWLQTPVDVMVGDAQFFRSTGGARLQYHSVGLFC
jgi:hypothetical protein